MRKFTLALFLLAREARHLMSMNVNDKARLYRELGKLFGASFPMDKSVAMLLDQHRSGAHHVFLQGLDQGLTQRLGFSESMKRYNVSLASELELSLIDSGERSGRLAEACEHLAHYFETLSKGIREARGAMIYPLILLHVGIIVPEFSRYMMMTNLPGSEGKELHLMPAILWRIGLFWVALVLGWLLWRSMSRAATRSEVIDRVLNMIPLIGSVRRHWALARFCQVFHSALLASMRITECLRMAGDASQSGTLLNGGEQAASNIGLGKTLAEAMVQTRRFPRLFTNAVQTSEASGRMDVEFDRWAQAETDMATESQRRAADWYPKILYFGVLGYIAVRVIGFASDYFGVITNSDQWMK